MRSKFYFYLLVTCRPDTACITYWRVKLSVDCHLMNQENFLLLTCHLWMHTAQKSKVTQLQSGESLELSRWLKPPRFLWRLSFFISGAELTWEPKSSAIKWTTVGLCAILCLANRAAATQVSISGFSNYVGFVFVNLQCGLLGDKATFHFQTKTWVLAAV